MDFCSQIVRNVELPASLSDFSKLTKLKGGIILKDAVTENGGLRVEGDLLWQGYAADNESGREECIWEGAEYFLETLPVSNLRLRDPFMMEPSIVDMAGVAADDQNCELTFTVRWWDEEEESEEKENFEKELTEIDENFRETIESFAQSAEEDQLTTVDVPESPEICEEPPVVRESKVTEICNDFRELRKKNKEEPLPQSLEVAEEIAPSPSGYCLRFYRAGESDSLETIADRFSVSLTKMRIINELDEVGSIRGRLIRIPK